MAYDSVQHFEEIGLRKRDTQENRIPEMIYCVFRYVIAINHFKDDLYVFEHQPEGFFR